MRIGPELFKLALVREIMQPPVEIQHMRRLDSSVSENCRPLNFITANLWHDWPRFKNITQRLEAFASLAAAENADILLLQEAARTPHLHASEWIAQYLDMHLLYAPSNGHPGIGFEEGLAILSRFPLSRPSLRRLGGSSKRSFVHRMALGASVETPCGEFRVFSVHLGLNARQNYRQVHDLTTWVAMIDHQTPVLIGGDFNAAEDSPQIQHARRVWTDTFRRLHPHSEAVTHTLRWPWGGILKEHRLDYIFLHNPQQSWSVLDSRHLTSPKMPHSDHHAVFTRLALAQIQ